MGGGGDGGGDGGDGSKNGKGKKGAGTKDGKNDASGDKKNGGEGEGDPVCPISGRVFLDLYDFGSPGPLPFRFIRSYSSRSRLAGDFGVGWTHAFGWRLQQYRRRVVLIDEGGREQEFDDPPKTGEAVANAFGWRLWRTSEGLVLLTPDGVFREFAKDWQTSVCDRHGNRILIRRAADGRLTGLVDSAGREFTVRTDARGRVASVTVPEDRGGRSHVELARYDYDAEGRLTSFTDGEGFVFRYRYDGNLLTEHETPTGLTYHYRYDGRDADAYCIESWGDYGDRSDPALEVWPPNPVGQLVVKGINYVSFTYDKAGRYTEVVDGLGGLTRYFGDEANRIRKVVHTSGGVTEYAYDPVTGDCISTTMPNGVVRQGEAGPSGLSAYSAPGLSVKRFYFDDLEWWFDEVKAILVKRAIDPHGAVNFIEHPDGTREHYTFDERGLIVEAVTRDGGKVSFAYDDMGNLVSRQRLGLPLETFAYDYLGRCTEFTATDGKRWRWTWDRRSEIVSVSLPNGASIHVDRDGLRHPTRIDRAGQVWHFEWGGIGWLTKTTDSAGRSVTTKYDVEGNVVCVVNPRGQVLRQVFDHAGRCIEVQGWEGVVMRAGYDLMSNAIWLERPGGREERAYDVASNLVEATTPEGAIQIEVDPIQSRKKVTAGAEITETFTDGAAQPTREIQGTHEVRIAWIGGKPAAVYADVGVGVGVSFQTSGLPSRLIAGETVITKNVPSATGWVDVVGRLEIERSYGADGQLARRTVRHTTDKRTLDQVEYDYDLRGNLRRERHLDGTHVEYDLDVADQVVERRVVRAGSSTVERWAYDRAGSPLREGATYDHHVRPVTVGDETRTYDLAGNLIERRFGDRLLTYNWSSTGELLKVTDGDRVVELAYDGIGRRVEKIVRVEGVIVKHQRYVWANNVVLHEVDELSGATRTYVREPNHWEPMAHVDRTPDGGEHCAVYLTNQVGGLDKVIDVDGAELWRAERSLFGAYEAQGVIDVSVRLLNQHWDDDVLLSYNLRRWYDPLTGQFVSPDPRLIEGWITPRDYVPNPTRFVDPLGLIPGVGGAGIPGLPAGFGAPGSSSSLLVPGPNAVGSGGSTTVGGATIPVPGFVQCTGPFAGAANTTNFPADLRAGVDAAGYVHGCHGRGPNCTGRNPGTTSGHFIPDHQPPRAQQGPGFSGTVRLYPHCLNCARSQGGQQSAASQYNTANSLAAGNAQGAFNQANPSPPNVAQIQSTAAALRAAGIMP